jgi:hypothetical protein
MPWLNWRSVSLALIQVASMQAAAPDALMR